MAFFTQKMKVVLDNRLVWQAKTFAQTVVKTTNYTDSNQNNNRKIIADHWVSKIGEEAVAAIFRHLNKRVNSPDYTIYKGQQKSWEADLLVEGVPLAVKTQRLSQAHKYGLSWTFQAAKKRYDPVLRQPNHWVCLVVCDDVTNNVPNTCYVYPPLQIKDLVFKAPILSHLQGKKKVVYAADLPFNFEQLR